MFHRRPSPEIRRSDLSMDFNSLIRHLQGDFPHLKEQEVLMVDGGEELAHETISHPGVQPLPPWKFAVDTGAYQGNPRPRSVPRGAGGHGIDHKFDVKDVDNLAVHPEFSATPEGSPVWHEFPRIIYHTCDQAAFLSIVENGFVPGGFPNKINRASSQLLQLHAAMES